MQNGLGISLKARHNNRWYADVSLYGFSVNYPQQIIRRADSLGFLPHYGEDFFKADQRCFSYEADWRLSFHPADYIRFETGKSRHFFGMGKRSLFLSDNSASHNFLSTEVKVWKLKYRWMLMAGKDYDLEIRLPERGLYTKYTALHYLSLNLGQRVNLNFFEAVVSNLYDQKGKRGFDMHFFNPVIFYRPVEFAAGTYDNALLGFGLNVRIFKNSYLYSQLIIDDLIISELKQATGWWGNKYGIQAGFKSYSLFNIDHLFFLSEINAVRPFTYSHARDNINYGNYQMPMAHPEGANFLEGIICIKYARDRFLFAAEAQLLRAGADTDESSFGGDIYRSYNERNDDYGVELLQGRPYSEYFGNVYVSYLLNPKIHVSLKSGIRYIAGDFSGKPEQNMFFYIGLSSAVFYNVF